MLKTSRYIIISAFFIFVFLLFFFFSPDSYNAELVSDVPYVIKNIKPSSLIKEQAEDTDYEIAVVADDFSDSRTTGYISLSLSLMHQDYVVCDSLYDTGDSNIIIIATPNINDGDLSMLTSYLSSGKCIIFAILPDSIEEGLRKLIGITDFITDYEILGFDIYEGILLGGMFRSKDLPLQCAKVSLSGACKVFANGHDPDIDKDALVIDREMENPLIWRTYYEGGLILVMNAPFLNDISGMGILTGLLSLAIEDFVYPIIGTSNVILDNFPYIGNDSGLIGSRNYYAFTRDIIWADLASVSKYYDIAFTCYTNGQFAGNKDAYDLLSFISNELYKQNKGEIGYTGISSLDSEVFHNDLSFLEKNFPSYILRSFNESSILLHAADSDMTSVLTKDWNEAFNWIDEQSIFLPVISDGLNEEYTDLIITSMASTIGLIMHRIDMKPVFMGEISWNEYSLGINKKLSNIFNKLSFLNSVNVKTTAEAAKDYLNLKMDVTSSKNEMTVFIEDNTGDISFILRTDKKIDVKKCLNCVVSQIEEGAYLIKSTGDKLIIRFSDSKEAFGR